MGGRGKKVEAKPKKKEVKENAVKEVEKPKEKVVDEAEEAQAPAAAVAVDGAAVVMNAKMVSVSGQEEFRALCFPHLKNYSEFKKKDHDWKKEVQLYAKDKGAKVLRQIEDTAYGFNNVLPFSTVTIQHPEKGNDMYDAMEDASFVLEGIKGCQLSLVVDAGAGVEAALAELAACMQITNNTFRVGIEFNPAKFDFAEYKQKVMIGFHDHTKDEFRQVFEALEKTEYGKLKYFSFKPSSLSGEEGEVSFKFDGMTSTVEKRLLIVRKSIFIANMCEEEFEQKNISIGGRLLKEYLGVSYIYGTSSIKECMHQAVRVSVGMDITKQDDIEAALATAFALTAKGDLFNPTINAVQRPMGIVERQSELLHVMVSMGFNVQTQNAGPTPAEFANMKEALAEVADECREANKELANLKSTVINVENQIGEVVEAVESTKDLAVNASKVQVKMNDTVEGIVTSTNNIEKVALDVSGKINVAMGLIKEEPVITLSPSKDEVGKEESMSPTSNTPEAKRGRREGGKKWYASSFPISNQVKNCRGKHLLLISALTYAGAFSSCTQINTGSYLSSSCRGGYDQLVEWGRNESGCEGVRGVFETCSREKVNLRDIRVSGSNNHFLLYKEVYEVNLSKLHIRRSKWRKNYEGSVFEPEHRRVGQWSGWGSERDDCEKHGQRDDKKEVFEKELHRQCGSTSQTAWHSTLVSGARCRIGGRSAAIWTPVTIYMERCDLGWTYSGRLSKPFQGAVTRWGEATTHCESGTWSRGAGRSYGAVRQRTGSEYSNRCGSGEEVGEREDHTQAGTVQSSVAGKQRGELQRRGGRGGGGRYKSTRGRSAVCRSSKGHGSCRCAGGSWGGECAEHTQASGMRIGSGGIFVPQREVIKGSDGNAWAISKEFTFELFVRVLSRMPKGKAVGMSGFANELLGVFEEGGGCKGRSMMP